MSYAVIFDSYIITEYFSVDHRMIRRLPTWEPSLIEVPGMNGAIYAGTKAEPIEITMTLIPKASDREDRQEVLRELARILSVSTPRTLILEDEGVPYRKAVPKGEMPIEPYLDADSVEVTFVCPDPRLYGSFKTKSLSTSASVSIGGTAPTRPTISGTVTPNSSGYWKVRESNTGKYMQVSMAAGSSHSLSIDCEKRIVKVDGDVVMLAPDSDWLEWNGDTSRTLLVDQGSGTVTVAWREMWW